MTMTDRELLEKAAKAAGLTVLRSRMDDMAHHDFLIEGEGVRNIGQRCYPWNPLTDDGDAFRLAVQLRMNIRLDGRPACVWIGPGSRSYFEDMDGGDDPYAATRRAIVRAAAAMVKEEKE